MSLDLSTVKRHKTLYLLGGDVALIAPRKLDSRPLKYVAFRLHTSMLPIWSSHFATIIQFTVRSEPNADEMYDGVPAVLMPDCAADLESLLNAAFHG